MLLIISDVDDVSTIHVMEWLDFRKVAAKRINGADTIESFVYNHALPQKSRLIYADGAVLLEEVSAYWYRRGIFNFQLKTSPENYPPTLARTLSKELDNLTYFLYDQLETKPGLGSKIKNAINKLKVLYHAQRVGLDIPHSITTTSKKMVQDFFTQKGALITKAIQDIGGGASIQGKSFIPYTQLMDQAFIDELPDEFFPAIFQEKLEKEYELRIFYLDGDCHSMAIFSQLDEQTKVDFRKYNQEKPNRRVPYQLSEELTLKIQQLMDTLGLDTGSIDMVVTKDKRYVFLEVNPVGQFGMVSTPCNYYLERKIADNLIGKSKKKDGTRKNHSIQR